MALTLLGQLRVAQTMPAGPAPGTAICTCGRRLREGEVCRCLEERTERAPAKVRRAKK